MKRTTTVKRECHPVRLRPQTSRKLRNLARVMGMSISELAGRAIEAKLEQISEAVSIRS